MDENFHVWKDDRGKVYGMLTSHVDDLAICGSKKFLDEMNDGFIKRFKKVSRHTLPFDHCGAQYSRTQDGFMITQKAFTERMKPATVPNGKKDDERLTPEEVTDFRSILGALLWLTSTRLDLVAEVSLSSKSCHGSRSPRHQAGEQRSRQGCQVQGEWLAL